MSRLRVLTWHIHGSYLCYLSHLQHDIYLPVKQDRADGYGGRCGTVRWPDNLKEVDAADVRNLRLDAVLFQSRRAYEIDQYEILSDEQRRLPRIYLEHDPPRENPTETRHFVDDKDVLLVHVTHFNDLMWNSGGTPTRVIEHGVVVSDSARYTGEQDRGITVINGLQKRGRRLGADLFEEVRREIPVDLVGMESELVGGLGEVPHALLPAFEASYRFFFNPIRYTSLGLAVCEAMMVGLPIIGLATTEMVTVVENGVSGYLSTERRALIEIMRRLLADPAEARRLGEGARKAARDRFSLDRFVRDWDEALRLVSGKPRMDKVLGARMVAP